MKNASLMKMSIARNPHAAASRNCAGLGRFVCLTLLPLLAFSAFATDYTWTGAGTSGAWDDAANWGGSGYPTGGDTATIGSAITITRDFAIDKGDVTINASASVTFDCVISGEGGLYNVGQGSLVLKKDNTFSGGVKTDGPNASLSACIDLYAGGGLGTGEACIENSRNQKGSRLNVYGPLTVTTPLKFGPDSSYGTLWTTNDVTFAANVNPSSRYRLTTAGGGGTLTFTSQTRGNGNWFPRVGRDSAIVFTCAATFSSGADIYTSTDNGVSNGGRVIFRSAGNDMRYLHVQSDSFVFDAENALPPIYTKLLFQSDNARLDICGHDQTITCISTEFAAPTTYNNSGFTNSSATAGRVIFSGLTSGLSALTFGGQLFGKTGLVWAPTSSEATFTFSTKSQPTTGDLVVSNGTVALVGGADFTSLARVEIGATGTLSFDDASGAAFAAGTLVLEDGGQLMTGAKTFMTVDSATVNGQPLACGYYGKDELPNVISGSGVLYVRALPAGAHVWTGGAGNGLWNDAANWGGELPQAGEDVLIEDASVTLDASTPALKSLYLVGEAQLTVTGWNTKIEAASFRLIDEGVLTCANGGTDADSISRLWIACTDFVVGKDATIDLDEKGYAPSPTGSQAGFGPGAGNYCFGAGHGGPGGGTIGQGTLFSFTYDDPADPCMPGSSGYWEARYNVPGNSGGGVLKIEASGVVSVYGTITANGGSAARARTGGSYNDTAGSGGTINITCARLVSRGGIIRAEGGEGDSAVYPSWLYAGAGCGQAGGGGMIAIRHGEGQQVSDITNATISAACGLYTGTGYPVTLATQDKYSSNADLGTVWFSDRTIVDATFGCGLSGRLVHPNGYVTAGDVAFTRGYVRLEGEGVTVSIGGNLSVDGAAARLEVGGLCYTNRSAATDVYCGMTPVVLSVGGDLTLANGGRLDVRAAETNGVDRFGATATVGGRLTVGSDSWLVAWCDVRNTGAPAFTVGGDFTVAAGGVVSSTRRGGAGGWNGGNETAGYKASVVGTRNRGFGFGAAASVAGSYGGTGGVGKGRTYSRAAAYGSAFYPSLPGSGGGAQSHGMSGSGGGLIYIRAAGAMTVDGTIEADGGYSFYNSWDELHNVSAGSGGAIFLSGRTFSGTGTLSAKGGPSLLRWDKDSEATQWNCSGSGGGGRIAVWTGEPVDESVRSTSPRITSATSPLAAEGGFSGTVTAAGGEAIYYRLSTQDPIPLADESAGTAGTVRFCKLRPKTGTMILMR